MRKVTIHAEVELCFNDVIDADGLCSEVLGDRRRSVAISLNAVLENVVLRIPPAGKIGQLDVIPPDGGQLITIKKLRLRAMQGDMLPVFDADNGTMVFFTTDNNGSADKPQMVEANK